MIRLIRILIQYSNAIQTMWLSTLKTSVATTRLGWAWWLADPLIMMAIYYFMVKMVFHRGGDNYHFFVLSGLVTWQFFTRNLTLTASSLHQNKNLIKRIGLPIEFYTVIPTFVQVVFAAVGYVLILILNPHCIGWQTLGLLPLMLLVGLISYGIGLIFSVWQTYLPDIGRFVQYALRAVFFLSPILYSADSVVGSSSVPQSIKALFYCNPMSWIMPAVRGVLIDGVMFNWTGYLIWLALVLLLVNFGLYRLRRETGKVVKFL